MQHVGFGEVVRRTPVALPPLRPDLTTRSCPVKDRTHAYHAAPRNAGGLKPSVLSSLSAVRDLQHQLKRLLSCGGIG